MVFIKSTLMDSSFRILVLSLLASFILVSCNQETGAPTSKIQNQLDAASEYIEGKHYTQLKEPVPTRDPTKVEVIEFFWLSCGHCFNVERLVSVWKKSLSKDIDFYQTHITWNASAETQARLMYTARALGIESEAITGAFQAIHMERQLMSGQSELESFFRGLGVQTERYTSISSSFGVNNAVSQADKRMKSFKIKSVPAFIVNGKYKVEGLGAAELLEVVDFLIEKERPYLSSLN